MSTAVSSDAALISAENIALLYLLDEVPSLPQVNDHNDHKPAHISNRVLSFGNESRFSRTIAFLSGVSNDADYVTATCVEEIPRDAGMRVHIAINKLKPTSGSGVMQRIIEGFQKIFALLSEAVDGASSDHVVLLTIGLRENVQRTCCHSKRGCSTLL